MNLWGSVLPHLLINPLISPAIIQVKKRKFSPDLLTN
ncbi:hypothetical protein Pat9b_0654 [Pantoea sp. At-9b]|nr:hypothetical protein Pat9b_0654 [Pantoea sp. At-9b]